MTICLFALCRVLNVLEELLLRLLLVLQELDVVDEQHVHGAGSGSGNLRRGHPGSS